MKRKILSFALALMMIVSVAAALPVSAETTVDIDAVGYSSIPNTTVNKDYVYYGSSDKSSTPDTDVVSWATKGRVRLIAGNKTKATVIWELTVPESGSYEIFTAATRGTSSDSGVAADGEAFVTVNGGTEQTVTIKGTDLGTDVALNSLGVYTLSADSANTLQISYAGTKGDPALCLFNFMLVKTEDVQPDPEEPEPETPIEVSGTILLDKSKTMYLNTTDEEVVTSTDYGDNYLVLKGGAKTYNAGGYYLNQLVDVKETGYYGVTANYARASSTNLWAIEVMASSTGKFTSRQLPPTGSNTTYETASLGYIYLEQGEQYIRIKGVGNGTGRVASVTLTKDVFTEDLEEETTIIPTGAGNLVDQNNVYTKAESAYVDTLYLRASTSYVTVGIYTQNEGMYNLSFNGRLWGSSTGHIPFYLNGVQEFDYIIRPTGSVAVHNLGKIHLKEGINEIKINGTNIISQFKSITLTRDTGITDTSLVIENEDGERMPYTVASGLKAYASATIVKEADSPSNYLLAIAQYSDERNMVAANVQPVDMSSEPLNSVKKVRIPLVMEASGGYIKAFLWDEVTHAPILEAQTYEDKVEDIFSPELVDSLLSETEISYVQAESLTNADGEYYSGYEIHDDSYDIDAIFYDGSSYDGKVFAYIGIPKSASESNKVPAVVLVHGGGGTAYRMWVKKWNDHGYAAIAMDLNGSVPSMDGDIDIPDGPVSGRHPYAGESWTSKWESPYVSNEMYNHAIDIIKAHTLISNHPCVDASKTAITGVSWGGIRTNIVMGLDDRFEVAVPVYGTGYLDKSHTYFAGSFMDNQESVYMDPANFASRAKMPVMLVCSDSDSHFSINSNSLTAGVISDSRLCIKHKFGHSHTYAWNTEQIYDFVTDVLNDGEANEIKITSSSAKDGVMTAECTIPSDKDIESVTMYYLTTGTMTYGGDQEWSTATTFEYADGTLTMEIPAAARSLYVSITDNDGHIISTKYMEVEK